MPSDTHSSDPHGSADVGDAHGDSHGDHGAPGSEPLGPIDVPSWAYALIGAALGLLVVAVLFVASA
jgi:hypothetical protein